ncbi:hypothetical protein [Marinobacter sp. MDS2]|uniref:hypothetical protein n=1 Tax=Marinobacter sp. MDS2 TaxID=3065961 RepID=UPI00273B369B|nr:hypothetical protein [Marinobacter sp. MDS2]MDP4546523.1 hypothetical protein [Marinobacter sp. MDS2]
MGMTAAQHQIQLDAAADLERLIERNTEAMRAELQGGGYYALEYRKGYRVVKDVYDRDNVIDQMIELDSDDFNIAVMMITLGEVEGVKRLLDLKARAIEQLIGLAKLHEDAEYTMELIRGRAA